MLSNTLAAHPIPGGPQHGELDGDTNEQARRRDELIRQVPGRWSGLQGVVLFQNLHLQLAKLRLGSTPSSRTSTSRARE